ncbi:glycosyl transferase family 51, partial [Pediococcus pentosaceus]|uniref:transglycosylase domain-containing protein n=1 Tax=Pediococcus pentosaceus TaxID=1255 RepID=UPI00223B97DC
MNRIKKHYKTYIFILFLLLLIGFGLYNWIKYKPTLKNLVNSGYIAAAQVKKSDFKPKGATKILDKNGNIIKTLSTTKVVYIPPQKISKKIKQALIVTEDKRFYKHHGVDLYAVFRSLLLLMTSKNMQGGSTITQQLVKNVILRD